MKRGILIIAAAVSVTPSLLAIDPRIADRIWRVAAIPSATRRMLAKNRAAAAMAAPDASITS